MCYIGIANWKRADMNLGIETEVLEFKKSTSQLKDSMDDICAMLNKHGYGT